MQMEKYEYFEIGKHSLFKKKMNESCSKYRCVRKNNKRRQFTVK